MGIYVYVIPQDERKAISEIRLRVRQAYGRYGLRNLCIFSADSPPVPFHRKEKGLLVSKLFDFSLTSWIDRLEVEQFKDEFSLHFHVVECPKDGHATNIGPELIAYVAGLLNKVNGIELPTLRRFHPTLIPVNLVKPIKCARAVIVPSSLPPD